MKRKGKKREKEQDNYLSKDDIREDISYDYKLLSAGSYLHVNSKN